MRRTSVAVATLGVAAALGLASCSSGSSEPSGGISSGTAVDTAACSLLPPSSGSPSSGQPAPVKAGGRVGVLLPEPSSTTGSPREAGLLTRSLEGAGLHPDLRFAPRSARATVAIARQMIRDHVEVLVFESVDTASGIRVERAAERAGVPVVDYQHMNLGGSARYLVSFDYEEIGRLEATAMMACLAARGVTHPRIILVDGGTDVDENAVLLAIGAHRVLDPLVTAGKAGIAEETTVRGWKTDRAASVFAQALTASGGQVDAVLAANDAIAGAIIGFLGDHGLERVTVSGQGFGTDDLQNIVTGRQSATVLTDPRLEAEAAAQLTTALLSGGTQALDRLPLATFVDPQDPHHRLRSLLLPGQLVTGANVADVVGRLGTTSSP